MKNVIAILCSDIHLSLKAPIARSSEPNWLDATKRSLDELRSVAEKYDVPIVCAGDIFEKSDPKPELINFAIENLPRVYAIPGNHDLKNHRYDEIEKSAYWTLVKAGRIKNLNPEYSYRDQEGNRDGYPDGKLVLFAFPWGFNIESLNDHDKDRTDVVYIAVIHHYIYTNKSNSYPGVSEDNHLSKFRKKLEGYDAVVSGDNHIGFQNGKVFNAGTLMRRHINEIDYKPQIGLLHSDGTITPHYLDTSKDLFLDEHLAKAKENQELDISRFLQELKSLGSDSLDFKDTVNRYMDSQKTDDDVRTMVLDSIE